ncbi:MAG: cobalt ECF transporter T component CbiQ [Chloroflexi bacterium]|nr:cobalt ECF transporter T component CbiQ [Chloroflexota bacterium]
MRVWIDQYAARQSPIHRWDVRYKLVALMALIFAFAFVRDLRLAPLMIGITAGLYVLSGLPVRFLVTRLRYPGYFMLVMAVILPFFAGQTVIARMGPLELHQEGLQQLALIVARFGCILTVGLVLFGTAPFADTVQAMRRLGLPDILADMTLLSFRYLFEIADRLHRMEIAMRLRGFRVGRLSASGLTTLAALAGSLLIRSFEQSERVYYAMKLRGYGAARRNGARNDSSEDSTQPGVTHLLEVRGVHFGYPDQPAVLIGIDLAIAAGERVGLIGPNGAGKTSLFLLISGVLKPDAGSVMLDGTPLLPGRFNPMIGLVFQNPDDQLFSPTVRDDIAFGPRNLGLDDDTVELRVQAALATAGVSALANRAPHHLSGGEKRMVAIASVLALNPQLVIYDEPDANLDVRARRRLIEFLRYADHTVLIASHDLTLILEVCDRVLVLDGGHIAAQGEPRVVLSNAGLMAAHGLEVPHALTTAPHMHPHIPMPHPDHDIPPPQD